MTKNTLDFLSEYIEIKRNHPGAVLFFRRGDFYEMYLDDATNASRILGTPLATRKGVTMTAVPWHSVAKFLGKMVRADCTVGVCEPQGTKYEVVRLVSPGHSRAIVEAGSPFPVVSPTTRPSETVAQGRAREGKCKRRNRRPALVLIPGGNR